MARVRKFSASKQRLKAHDTYVDCEVGIIGTGANQLLHLSTFGSDDRVSERKSSQSMQLDVQHAVQLVEILADFIASAHGPHDRRTWEIPRH